MSSIVMDVPFEVPSGRIYSSMPPLILILIPASASLVFVTISALDTAAILASASPLKPREKTLSKSSAERILLVACLKNAVLTSSAGIPQPSSVIRINVVPPSFISTVMLPAPASIAFSISSFTTDPGLSTTSPAAILFIVLLSRSLILFMSITFP